MYESKIPIQVKKTDVQCVEMKSYWNSLSQWTYITGKLGSMFAACLSEVIVGCEFSFAAPSIKKLFDISRHSASSKPVKEM